MVAAGGLEVGSNVACIGGVMGRDGWFMGASRGRWLQGDEGACRSCWGFVEMYGPGMDGWVVVHANVDRLQFIEWSGGAMVE